MPAIAFSNILPGERVFQRLLLVHGSVTPITQSSPPAGWETSRTTFPTSDYVRVTNLAVGAKAHDWPVVGGTFKALVWLNEGTNEVEFKYAASHGGDSVVETLVLEMETPMDSPPLNLSITAASDSLLRFDTPDWAKEEERAARNGLEEAQRRVRMAAYLWQAFTAEQMYRNGFGRRTFRLAEELLPDTLFDPDSDTPQPQPPVPCLRSKYPLSVIRDPRLAQQKDDDSDDDGDDGKGRKEKLPDSLFDVAMQALGHEEDEDGESVITTTATDGVQSLSTSVSAGPSPVPPSPAASTPTEHPTTAYHASLLIDSTYVPSPPIILAHTALGGGTSTVRLAVFGSHLTHSWPSCLSEVPECMWDDRDRGGTADDNGQTEVRWMAFGVGAGAFLHEAGHAFGLGHSGEGIMARGYIDLDRTFLPISRSVPPSLWPVTAANERGARWHRVDMVRLRGSECFHIPTDTTKPRSFAGARQPVLHPSSEPYTYEARCADGVVMAHFTLEDDAYLSHVEYAPTGDTAVARIDLMDAVRRASPMWPGRGAHRPKIDLTVVGHGGGECRVNDVLGAWEGSVVRKARPGVNGRMKGGMVGNGGGAAFVVTWGGEEIDGKWVDRAVSEVRLHAGTYLDGMEVVVEEWDADGGAPPAPGGTRTPTATTTTNPTPTSTVTTVTPTPTPVPHIPPASAEEPNTSEPPIFTPPRTIVHAIGHCRNSTPTICTFTADDPFSHFLVRSGAWIDALATVTASGVVTWAGGNGGREGVLVAPEGAKVVGVWGTVGERWLDGVGVVYEVGSDE